MATATGACERTEITLDDVEKAMLENGDLLADLHRKHGQLRERVAAIGSYLGGVSPHGDAGAPAVCDAKEPRSRLEQLLDLERSHIEAVHRIGEVVAKISGELSRIERLLGARNVPESTSCDVYVDPGPVPGDFADSLAKRR